MKLNEYQEFFVAHQKNYDIAEQNILPIIALGLAGETGEATECIKKYIRDGYLDKKELSEELGDVLAYLALVAAYFDLPLEDIAITNITKNQKRKEKGTLHGHGSDR